jgi:gluconate:H+ symporter, GntP family
LVSLFILLLIMVFVVLATSKFQMHPFLVLLLAAIFMGLFSGLNSDALIKAIAEGFGGTLKSIGIVIACGTIIGTFLEKSGGAKKMAETVLKIVGEKKSPLAMSITGYLVSIPVFCDSGFVLLSALNKALSKKTGKSLAVLAIALATGLLTTHVFVPPTPGPLAAAANIGADIGLVLLFGLLVSIPTALAGLLWATTYCKRFNIIPKETTVTLTEESVLPNNWQVFLPLVLPIVLISLKSIADYPTLPFGEGFAKSLFDFIGNPIIALLLGVFLAFALPKQKEKSLYQSWVGEGLKNAGTIILITGAGGAFGSVLKSTNIGTFLGETLSTWHLGIFLPFIIAAALKTAQGSSTVALITTSALIAPLLGPMGLGSPIAKALVVLAIGAGSMIISHANDSYFWVVSQFSDMDTPTALKTYSMATLIQGSVGIITIAFLCIFFI